MDSGKSGSIAAIVNMGHAMVSPSIWLFARAIAYLIFTAGLASIGLVDKGIGDTDALTTESSLIEITCIGLLALISGLALVAAARTSAPGFRPLLVVLSILAACGLVRELDFYLDNLVADGAWQILVGLLLAAAIAIYGIYRDSMRSVVREVLETSGFGLMLAGALTTVVFSRMFGRQDVWSTVMQEHYHRSAKNLAEENLELFGVGLILIGLIELLLYLRRRGHPGDRQG